MDTILYTSDIDGIHTRITNVLESKNKSQGQIKEQNYNIDCGDYDDCGDCSDFIVSIGNDDSVTAEIGNEDSSGDILKKKYEKMSAVEMRMCEMEMVKYKQMLAQHEYEKGYRKKASILERELNSKTVVKECNSLEEFAKALDVSHSKWMRCSKKLKEKYIKEYVYRKNGIPIEKKSRKGGGGKKSTKSAFNVASINLNTCEPGVEPNICVKTIGKDDGDSGGGGKKTDEKTKKKPEITEEIVKELEKYLENLNNNKYDDPDNITYDYKNKRIDEIAL